MSSGYEDALMEVFCETVEHLAFMFGDPLEDEATLDAGETYCRVTMHFKGERAGSLVLAVPGDLRAVLAANMLGVDADAEKAHAFGEDALKELLNVTCGQLLTRIAGEQPVFDLSPPELSMLDRSAWRDMFVEPTVLRVLVDDCPALLRVHIDANHPNAGGLP